MTASKPPMMKAIFLISFSTLRYRLPSITRRPQRISACIGERAKKIRKANRAMTTAAYFTISDKGLIFKLSRSSISKRYSPKEKWGNF